MIKINFEHRQSAHCENGATSNLLHFKGLNISEPLVFGIGAGLFFGYFPFIKLNYIPLISFRHVPGKVFNQTTRLLDIKVEKRTYRDQQKAMDDLDRLLEKGIPTGVQTGAFWLPYFPSAYRFHFNMHNIVVYGKENGQYLISDPNFEHPVTISYEDLVRARFSKGPLAPKGKLYYIVDIPDKPQLEKPVIRGIKEVSRNMIFVPVPILGVHGIRYLAKKMRRWPEQLGDYKAALYLGQVIRMQEEIGTGGAGFRFIFSSFLQEASEILNKKELFKMSEEMTAVGDRWREFATGAARICKGRQSPAETYDAMANILMECAEREKTIYKKLFKVSLKPNGKK